MNEGMLFIFWFVIMVIFIPLFLFVKHKIDRLMVGIRRLREEREYLNRIGAIKKRPRRKIKISFAFLRLAIEQVSGFFFSASLFVSKFLMFSFLTSTTGLFLDFFRNHSFSLPKKESLGFAVLKTAGSKTKAFSQSNEKRNSVDSLFRSKNEELIAERLRIRREGIEGKNEEGFENRNFFRIFKEILVGKWFRFRKQFETEEEIALRLERRRLGLPEEIKEKKMAGFTGRDLKLRLEKTEPNKKDDSWEFSVIAIVTSNSNPADDIQIKFKSYGPEEEDDTILTDSEGRAEKDYSLSRKGKYTIEAYVVGSPSVRGKVVVELKDEKKKQPKDLEVRSIGSNGKYYIIATVVGEEGMGLKGHEVALLRPNQDAHDSKIVNDKGVCVFEGVEVKTPLEEITVIVLGTNINKTLYPRGPRKAKAVTSEPTEGDLKNIFTALFAGLKKG